MWTVVASGGWNSRVKSGAGNCCFSLQSSWCSKFFPVISQIFNFIRNFFYYLYIVLQDLYSHFIVITWILFSLWTAEYYDERGTIQSSSKFELLAGVVWVFFSWSTCGLTVYTSDNLLYHAAWAILSACLVNVTFPVFTDLFS